MRTFCQLDPQQQTSAKLEKKEEKYIQRTCKFENVVCHNIPAILLSIQCVDTYSRLLNESRFYIKAKDIPLHFAGGPAGAGGKGESGDSEVREARAENELVALLVEKLLERDWKSHTLVASTL